MQHNLGLEACGHSLGTAGFMPPCNLVFYTMLDDRLVLFLPLRNGGSYCDQLDFVIDFYRYR